MAEAGSHRRDDQRRKVPKGFCTWCGDELLVTAEGLEWARENLKPRDEVFKLQIGDRWPRVRSWHPWCVKVYMLRNNSGMTRHYVWLRDQGQCAIGECEPRTGLGFAGRYGNWEADHIVPLADGGSFEMENLQTLCRRHHKEKTKREAGERAERRRCKK